MASNQFDTLVKSYRDNYIQHEVTGDPKFKKTYSGAEKGIQNILFGLQKQVDTQTKSIDNLYSNNIDSRVKELQSENKSLLYGIVREKDNTQAAEERQNMISSSIPTPVPSMTTYYVAIGVLVAAIVGLRFV